MFRSTLLACVLLSASVRAQEAWPDQQICPPDSPFSVGPHSAPGAGFGSGLAERGGRMVIGARDDATGQMLNRGAAYVFDWSAAQEEWIPTAKLFASSPGTVPSGGFGSSVALSDQLIAVGSPLPNQGPATHGFVEVFAQGPLGFFLSIAQLAPPSGGANGGFGESLAIRGSRIFVGASRA
jgi:FG-GAP repeat